MVAGVLSVVVVIFLCIAFRHRPRKPLFVYPVKTAEGKKALLVSCVRWITLLLSILRAFNIHRKSGAIPTSVPSHNIMFLLDGSLSMSANDVAPNRFARARSIISTLSSAAPWAQQGLIVFSGLPVLRAPRTNDIPAFQQLLSDMKLWDFPPTDSFLGTALGDALLLSLQQFSLFSGQRSRTIIIISDGDSNKGYDPYSVLGVFREQHIPVHFITLGEDGYTVGKDSAGLPVTTFFDTELMEQFTDQTQGQMYRNPSAEELQELGEDIKNQSAKDTQTVYMFTDTYLNDSLRPWLLLGFLLLLISTLRELLYKRRV